MGLPAGIIATPRADGRTVYHNGSIFDGRTPVDLPGYTDNGVTVPFHGWLQQWTFRPSPIAVRRSPAQIVAANQMFPYGDTGCAVGSVANYTFKGPMDSAGITKYFPTTGERPDLGLVSDPGGEFMRTGNGGPMLAWAQAVGSFPMHYRDEQTGRPIDLTKYPVANQYSQNNQGWPWMPRGQTRQDSAGNWWPTPPDGWEIQQAHYGEFSYLAFMATLDLGFLEDLQYSANFMVLADAYMSARRGVATIYGEYRGVAWAFRNLFMAHIATKYAEGLGILPSECHPSSYWKTLLDNQLAYYSQFMADPANQVFRLVCGPGTFGPWQVDYMLTALAFGVLSGHADWTPLYLWALKNAIDRTSGESGYPPGYGGAYYMPGDQPDWKSSWLTGIPTLSGAQPPTAAQIATLTADPLNGGRAMIGNEYLMTTRAVLVMATYLESKGLANVRAMYPELDTCIANVDRMVRNYGSMNPRVSVVLDASQAPTDIPQLPITPPAGEIRMSNPGNLAVGQSAHFNLTFDDGHGQPSQAPVNLVYTSSPNVSVAADASGGVATGLAAGDFTITATADNCPPVSISGAVSLPLAAALHLSWG